MWSNSLRREGERDGQQYQEYQQQQQPPPPPPPPQQQAYPPPAPQYSDYPDDSSYPGGDGALASTINLVASGVSALFRAPPSRVPVQQHQPPHPPVNSHFFPPPLHPESSMLNSEPPSHVETFHQPAVQTYPPPAVQTFQQKPAAAVPQSYASPVMSPALQPAATIYMPPPVSSASPAPSPVLQPAATTYTPPSAFFQAPARAAQPAATNYLPPRVATASPVRSFSALQPAATTYAPPPVPFQAPAPALQPVATTYVPPAAVHPAAATNVPPPVAAASPIPSPTMNAAAMPSPTMNASATYAPPPVGPIKSPALNAAATYVAPPVAAAYPTPSPVMQPLSNVAATFLPPAKASPVLPLSGMSQPLPRTFLSRSTPPASPRSTASSKFTASPKSTSSSKFKLPPLALPRPVHHPSPRTKKWGGFKVPPPITNREVQSEVKKPPSSPSGKSVSSVPTGITFHWATSAPSPMASPRLDTSFESTQNDETTYLPPPVFAVAGAAPQTNVPLQAEEWTEPPCTNMQAEESATPSFVPSRTAPQIDAPVSSVVAPPAYQVNESPSPPYVAPPPAFVSPNESAPPWFFASANATAADETPRPPPPPALVVTPGNSNVPVWAEETTRQPLPPPPAFVATPVTSAPPQFVATPEAQVDKSISPLFSSSPSLPSQIEESAPPPPTFHVPVSESQAPFVAPPNVLSNVAVRVAAPPHVDSKSMYGPPPADNTARAVVVSAFDAHGAGEPLPPVNMPSFEGESPENEVPELDHNSAVYQLEPAPEQTVTQEHVEEERFIEPPPEEERSQPLIPDGWTEVTDPASGQTYYCNEEIGVSSWERPAAEELLSTEDAQNIELLPDGRTKVTDPASGQTYFYNEERGLSSRERPAAEELLSNEDAHNIEFSYDQVEEEKETELPPEPTLSQQVEEEEAGDVVVDSLNEEEVSQFRPALPFGWIEQVDPSTGMSYFHNVESGVTTWERPFEEEPTNEERVANEDSTSAEVGALPDRRTEKIDGGRTCYHDALEATDTTADEDNTDEQVHVAGEEETDKLEFLEETEQNKRETESRIEDHEDVCAPLPAGWLEYIDRTCGRPYYVNSTQNITSWDRPQVPNSSPTVSDAGVDDYHVAEASPDAGIESPSPQNDTQTGTDSLPESTSFIAAAEEQASETARTKHTDYGSMTSTNDLLASESGSEEAGNDDAEGKLPAESELYSEEAETLGVEWDELVDPASGLTYYYNVVHGTLSWDRPVATQDSDESQNQAHQISVVEHRLSESDLSTADIGNPPESTSQHAEDADDDWNLVSSMDTPEVVTDPFHDDGNPEVQVESATRTTLGNEETSEQHVDVPQLPPDWKEFIDTTSGNPYFVNEVTNATTWERPDFGEATLNQPAGAPAENEQPVSEVNRVRTTDNPETELDVSLETFNSETDTHAAHDKKRDDKKDAKLSAEAPLPSGWAAMVDPPSGKTYYVNEAENQSTWERPGAEFPSGPEEVAPRDEPPKGETQLFDEDGTDGSLSTRSKSQSDEYGLGDGSTDEKSSSSESEQMDESDGQKLRLEPDETDPLTLPPGWIEFIDVTSGRPYYANEADNTTSWEKPVVDRPQPDTEVEPESSNVRSKDKTERAGETILSDEQDISSSVQREAEVVHDRDKVEDAAGGAISVLPAGWIEEIDPASGNPFYINEAENMTTWERPESFPEGRAITDEVPPIIPEELSASSSRRSDDTVDDYTLVEHSETVLGAEPPANSSSCELPDDGQPELPSGWVELFDDASGSHYYMNEAENISTWERPSSAPSKGGLSEKQEGDIVIEKQKRSPFHSERKNGIEHSPLPSGWAEAVDPETGKTYYFHDASNMTTWDRPNDAVRSDEIDRIAASAGTKERKPASVFATFGFGGKLCVWKSHAPSTVVLLRAGDLMKTDPVVLAEQKKKESNVVGPLIACEDAAVLNHIESKATDGSRNEAPCHDLLWSLVLIAAKSNGRLRSDDGVQNARSPEAGVITLLLDDTNGEKFDIPRADMSQDEELKGEVADLSSLKNVEKLLLWGKREEAVQEAIRSKNFAMALLVASMCDRATFQEATKQFADDILSTGSPLHTLAMLFSGQLQPPADSSLDRNGAKTPIWDDITQQLHLTWRQHLAATISNRTLGWDRIVLSLGDHLLDSGSIQAAHFCFVVCGCPVTSLLHPSSRLSLVGCDHLVSMDAALMTLEGVSSYERTEAYEWAKRRGNPNAAIPSLQPFKLMYAMLLADMGFGKHAEMYVRSIRQCCGSGETMKSESPDSISSTVWALSVRNSFEAALDEFEDRLSQGKLRGQGMPQFGSESSALIIDASTALPPEARRTAAADPAVDIKKQPALKVKVKRSRSKKVSTRHSSEVGIVTEAAAFEKPDKHCEDVNATFLSAQSNLLDVTASSKVEELSTEPTKRTERRRSFVETAGRVAGERKMDSNATEKSKVEVATIPGKGQMTIESSASKTTDVVKKELKVKPPPNSAPAFLGSSKSKSAGASPQKAPSSDKKGSKWGLGIKDKMTKWLNPDATTADLGEGMQAYYDEKRKVWVFPGEDPEEKAKPIGPPPTAPTATEKAEESPKAPMDPLAAMMAPPQRATSFRRTSSILSQNEIGGSLASHYPGMMPPGVAKSPGSVSSLSLAGPPPQFTVFKPVTKDDKESTK